MEEITLWSKVLPHLRRTNLANPKIQAMKDAPKMKQTLVDGVYWAIVQAGAVFPVMVHPSKATATDYPLAMSKPFRVRVIVRRTPTRKLRSS